MQLDKIRVFIADDEHYIINTIRFAIDWEELNMEIVGWAENGELALKKILETNPNIIVTDIRMPGLDGIELIREVKKQNNRIKFIIISGYKQFEYAQKALKYGVEDYLLKPIEEEELVAVLKRLRQALYLEYQNDKNTDSIHQQMEKRKSILGNYILNDLMIKPDSFSSMSLTDINDKYLTSLKKGQFRLILLKIDGNDFSDATIDIIVNKLTALVFQIIKGYCYEILTFYKDYELSFFINYDVINNNKIMLDLNQFIIEGLELIKNYGNESLTIGVGLGTDSFANIAKMIQTSNYAIKSRIVEGLNKVIVYEELIVYNNEVQNLIPEENLEAFLAAIEQLDLDNIEKLIRNQFIKLDFNRQLTVNQYWEICEKYAEIFFNFLSRYESKKSIIDDSIIELRKHLYMATSPKMLIERLITFLKNFLINYFDILDRDLSPSIRIAKKYIVDNYKKNITLTEISSLVHLSTVYFSILFKKNVGKSFIEFINSYRVEVSKNYLKDINFNINEIADEVGFSSSRYYSRIFKKYVGITPSEYRRKYIYL